MKKILLFLACFSIALFTMSEDKIIVNKDSFEIIMRTADKFRLKNIDDSALIYYSRIYNNYDKSLSDNDKHISAMAYYWAARICFTKWDYISAIDFFLKGIKIMETCNNKKGIAEFYKCIGDMYWLNEDKETAIQCYTYGYKNSIFQKDTNAMIRLANNMAGLYAEMREYRKAIEYIKKATTVNKDTVFQKYMNLYNLGMIEKNKKNYTKAIDIYNSVANYSITNKMHPAYECSAYDELYRLYMATNNKDSMKFYMFKCYNMFDTISLIDVVPRCLRNLSTFYANTGDFKNAYKYLEEYYNIMDSVFQTRDINRMKNMHRIYEDEKKNTAIANLQRQKQKGENIIISQKRTIVTLVCGIICIIIIVLYLYWQKKKFSYLYKKLFSINNEIVSSEKYNRELRLEYERILKEKNEELEKIRKNENTNNDKDKKYTTQLKKEQKSLLLEAIVYIMENTEDFCSIDFSLDKLAKAVNSNSSYVSQTINDTYGKSFNTYVNEYRVREARKRLVDKEHYGNYTIKAISESVGYKSQTTFIKVFKEITGMTPSMFQKISLDK